MRIEIVLLATLLLTCSAFKMRNQAQTEATALAELESTAESMLDTDMELETNLDSKTEWGSPFANSYKDYLYKAKVRNMLEVDCLSYYWNDESEYRDYWKDEVRESWESRVREYQAIDHYHSKVSTAIAGLCVIAARESIYAAGENVKEVFAEIY